MTHSATSHSAPIPFRYPAPLSCAHFETAAFSGESDGDGWGRLYDVQERRYSTLPVTFSALGPAGRSSVRCAVERCMYVGVGEGNSEPQVSQSRVSNPSHTSAQLNTSHTTHPGPFPAVPPPV